MDEAEWAGLELVAAVRRQLGFMKRILSLRDSISAQADMLETAVTEYKSFLMQAGSMPSLEPSLIVDLVWHTHMQFSDAYARDCIAVAGRFIDHIDEVCVCAFVCACVWVFVCVCVYVCVCVACVFCSVYRLLLLFLLLL